MAEDPPQQPVEQRDEPAPTFTRGKSLDSMGVAQPVAAWLLPDATQPQATAGDNGASPQTSAQDAAPVDHDG
jgi:hypothetical protein